MLRVNHLFLICLFVLGHASSLYSYPAQVLIIRNSEDIPKKNTLSVKGKERSAAYVPYFMERKEMTEFGNPVAIYTMKAEKNQSVDEYFDTVKPLSDALGITILQTYERTDYKKMAEEIKSDSRYSNKTVLICWDHKLVPELCRALGALQSQGRWLDTTYDRVWSIHMSSTGRTTFTNIPQKLMYGDTSN